MNILIVSKCPTHPTDAGNRRFILNQNELFKHMGHNVHFLFIDEVPLLSANKDIRRLIEMRNYWGDKFHVYKVSRLQHLISLIRQKYRLRFQSNHGKVDDYYINNLDKVVNYLHNKYRFDCCLVNYYYLTKLLKNIKIPLKGLVTHDYFSYKSLLVENKSIAYNLTADQEAIALQRSPHIFALNTEEAIFFKKLSPNSNVYNIFSSYKYIDTPIVQNHVLLFLSGSNMFNINGLKWFLSEIYPDIKTHFHDVRLIIGGSICKHISHLIADESVDLLGYISDEDEFYAQGDVVINPTYQGTGLKIKTFEAVSYGKVTMCHPHSKIGIYDESNSPIFASAISSDWINFLEYIWNENSQPIADIKIKSKAYLESMQCFIESEYDKFFKSLRK